MHRTPLARTLARAAKKINAENSIKLKKLSELGDYSRGAGVYRDDEWGEYRVLFVTDDLYQREADAHCDNYEDAWATAKAHAFPQRG